MRLNFIQNDKYCEKKTLSHVRKSIHRRLTSAVGWYCMVWYCMSLTSDVYENCDHIHLKLYFFKRCFQSYLHIHTSHDFMILIRPSVLVPLEATNWFQFEELVVHKIVVNGLVLCSIFNKFDWSPSDVLISYNCLCFMFMLSSCKTSQLDQRSIGKQLYEYLFYCISNLERRIERVKQTEQEKEYMITSCSPH